MAPELVFSLLCGAAVLILAPPPAPARPKAPGDDKGGRVGLDLTPLNIALLLELLGTALSAGLSLSRGLAVVAEQAGAPLNRTLATVAAGLALGVSWEAAWEAAGAANGGAETAVRQALDFAAATGAPTDGLLFAEAARVRSAHHRAAEKRAAALGVKLVLPLGLCFLPAFLALGVIPVVLSLLSAMG